MYSNLRFITISAFLKKQNNHSTCNFFFVKWVTIPVRQVCITDKNRNDLIATISPVTEWHFTSDEVKCCNINYTNELWKIILFIQM